MHGHNTAKRGKKRRHNDMLQHPNGVAFDFSWSLQEKNSYRDRVETHHSGEHTSRDCRTSRRDQRRPAFTEEEEDEGRKGLTLVELDSAEDEGGQEEG